MVKEYKEKEFFNCEFCRCRTNANLRRCCELGYEADLRKSKKLAGESADVQIPAS